MTCELCGGTIHRHLANHGRQCTNCGAIRRYDYKEPKQRMGIDDLRLLAAERAEHHAEERAELADFRAIRRDLPPRGGGG